MSTFSTILLLILAVEHLVIAFMEIMGTPEKQAKAFDLALAYVKQPEARISMANQGIYNGMLAIIIIFAQILITQPNLIYINILLASFITVVGFFGGLTATKKIFLVQMTPGLLAVIVSTLALYF
ncbi:DUF1304 domain-containing protein [Lactobacillus psittaci]|uniref:Integral membrane protein n=1 Tax=Lactobacillus psittaci DSM 15354 TaxID=1122152 RepID=A0A0R1S2L1_9LACO|nr:DUF1304 domain-containing protein [Lactobacillus psittaci]KRL62782.1 hypothetical protein FC23_GL001253 [Lactobacillus psittaci DSM 15354]